MKATKRFGILIALVLLIAACDTAYGPEYRADGNPAKIRGKVWQWVGYTTMNGGYFTDVPRSNGFMITGDTIEGGSGCNPFWGICRLDRSTMKLEGIMSKLLGCEPNKTFICNLTEGVVQYSQRDSMLVLVPESGEMVHLFFKMQ